MTGVATSIRLAFDRLYEFTSNEITEDRPYADTRSREGVYAITNVQQGNHTYAAGEFQHDRERADGSTPRNAHTADSPDSEDPETDSTPGPRAPATD